MQVRIEKKIDAPASVTWQVLGPQFVDIDQWASFVKTSRPLEQDEIPAGVVAATNAPVLGRETMTKVRIAEVITAYSDENRVLTFRGVGLPKIVRLIQDEQSVRADSDTTCTVRFDVTLDLVGPFAIFGPVMKRRMANQFGGILDDLKAHVEALYSNHTTS